MTREIRKSFPFARRTRRSERRDVHHGTAREREKRAGGPTQAQKVRAIIEATIALDIDQQTGAVY